MKKFNLMKKARNAHLWIGLICSVFILIQSITGLLMTEPWLMGQTDNERQMERPEGQFPGFSNDNGTEQGTTNESSSTLSSEGSEGNVMQPPTTRDGGGDNSLMGIVKGLHEGKIGNIDVSWLIDIVAISMIFLTITGIYLSVKTLTRQSVKKKKQRMIAS